MAKEIINVTPADMGDIEITSAALDVYRFARSLPVEMDEGAGVEVIRSLSKKGLLTVDQALCEVTVDAVVRASGIDKNKLISMFPDAIVEEPKKTHAEHQVRRHP